MNCFCFLDFSTLITRTVVQVTLKIFIDLAANFGSTVSHIQVNINIFRNNMIHATPLYVHSIVVIGYINNCFAYTRIAQ